ncbi:MAG: hypothetical protein R3275_10905 [Saprospiraceae bacterium]|nr:hypothetical protein [Saprospiraceae bacterium]
MKLNAFLLITVILLGACKNRTDSSSENLMNETPGELPDDFTTFYKKFHEDTAYQMRHIIWPLPGQPSMLDSLGQFEDDKFYWERSEWIHHKPYSPESQFNRDFEIISDFIVNETFTHQEMPIHVLRRFAKTSDGWQLIFYSGPNRQ